MIPIRWSMVGMISVLFNGPEAPVAAQQAVATLPPPSVTSTAAARALLQRPVTVAVSNVALRKAVDVVAAAAGVQLQFRARLLEQYRMPVTLDVTRVPLGRALDQILSGTTLQVVPLPGGLIAIHARGEAWSPGNLSGTIMGTIMDAKTHLALSGVTILVDDATRGVVTGADGKFYLASVGSGAHVLYVRLIGYMKTTRAVTVTDGQSVMIDIELESSTNVLDQVVVTGTVAATELRAVSNAMTVITARDIEQRGITKIDQLFRGDVPGLFAQNQGASPSALLDEVTMFSRGATALSTASAGTSGGTNPIKTYVDGVELADPKYLSQIDPKSIERIEILTGPQASTIYGSNAINGVMQIFTKRGHTSTPLLTLNLLSGWVENNFSDARTPQHDCSAQLSGVEGRLSYNAGGSWNYMGPWTPAKQTTRTGGFGGGRLDLPTELGRVTTDITLRHTITQNTLRGATGQAQTGYQEAGWYVMSGSPGRSVPTTSTLTGQTLGITLGYIPASWWSHEIGIGLDASDTEARYTERGYTSRTDTTLRLDQNHTDRRSLRYTTTARVPVTSFAQATVTAGVDAWQNLTSAVTVLPQTLTGALTGAVSVSRQPGHNAGAFLQGQFSIGDRLFVTPGLRVEWNPGYGSKARVLPGRYGAAYTQEFGVVTAKLRGSYGRSTRPPGPNLKVAWPAADAFGLADWSSAYAPYYDNYDLYLANPQLGPEYQQGGEGGLELYFGTRGSLGITRYNQTVDNLIDLTKVDSVRSLAPCLDVCPAAVYDTDGYGYQPQYQYLNVASIRNQGWELQGSINVGPLTTHGIYSWTKSRTIGANPKYRSYFTPQNYPQYQPGATFQYLPEHTWAFGLTYAYTATMVSLNITGTGQATNFNDDFFLRYLSGNIRLPLNRFRMTSSGYVNHNNGYALADLSASHRLFSRADGVLQVQNLTDRYTNDFLAAYATMGRQTKIGLRLRLQ